MDRQINTLDIFLLIFVFALLAIPAIAEKEKGTSKNTDGAQIFAQRCAKCHAGGGNSIKSSKPLAGSNYLKSIATFKAYLKSPTGHMPYYDEIVENKKSLQALYDYCKTLNPKPGKGA